MEICANKIENLSGTKNLVEHCNPCFWNGCHAIPIRVLRYDPFKSKMINLLTYFYRTVWLIGGKSVFFIRLPPE